MSKAKPFNREKGKSALEDYVVDTVQNYFQNECERAKQKNKSKKKLGEENPKIEEFFKMFENMKMKLGNFKTLHFEVLTQICF